MAQPVSTEVYSRDAVYRQMRRQIIDFTLLPGELLSENTLAAQMHTSRTPVREAIQILEGQKLVYVVPGRATVVADIDTTDIEKCYRTLAELQALAAELACGSITDQELAVIESADENGIVFREDEE